MKVNPNLVIIAGLALGAGYVAWKAKQAVAEAGEAVADAGQAINPVNPDNIFARGVNRVVQVLSDDPNQTLGGQIYDWVNGTQLASQDQLRDLGTTQQQR